MDLPLDDLVQTRLRQAEDWCRYAPQDRFNMIEALNLVDLVQTMRAEIVRLRVILDGQQDLIDSFLTA